MLHGVLVVIATLLMVPILELIPLASLAALVMAVGIQMVSLNHIRTVTRHREVLVYVVTTLGVVLLGVLQGVALGIAVAVGVALHRLTRTRITHEVAEGVHHVQVRGQLTFLAVPRLSRILHHLPHGCDVVVELDGSFMDHAAYETLQDWQNTHTAGGGTVELTGRRAGVRIAEPVSLPDRQKESVTDEPDTSADCRCSPWTPWRNHQCEVQQPLLASPQGGGASRGAAMASAVWSSREARGLGWGEPGFAGFGCLAGLGEVTGLARLGGFGGSAGCAGREWRGGHEGLHRPGGLGSLAALERHRGRAGGAAFGHGTFGHAAFGYTAFGYTAFGRCGGRVGHVVFDGVGGFAGFRGSAESAGPAGLPGSQGGRPGPDRAGSQCPRGSEGAAGAQYLPGSGHNGLITSVDSRMSGGSGGPSGSGGAGGLGGSGGADGASDPGGSGGSGSPRDPRGPGNSGSPGAWQATPQPRRRPRSRCSQPSQQPHEPRRPHQPTQLPPTLTSPPDTTAATALQGTATATAIPIEPLGSRQLARGINAFQRNTAPLGPRGARAVGAGGAASRSAVPHLRRLPPGHLDDHLQWSGRPVRGAQRRQSGATARPRER
ncbi:hypothetical protein GCM10020295_38280 [Streptomyces cinereospinus]